MTDPLAALRAAGFDVAARNHAAAILSVDFPAQTAELTDALLAVRIPVTEIVGSGGGEAPSTRRLRRALAAAGWPKHVFRTEISVDGAPRKAASHEVDHVRRVEGVGALALKIEWNNKDPSFDHDLEISSACTPGAPSAWACWSPAAPRCRSRCRGWCARRWRRRA